MSLSYSYCCVGSTLNFVNIENAQEQRYSLKVCFKVVIAKVIWARSCENVFYVICEQQRCRSACTAAQSDQHLCFRCLDSMLCILVIYKV